MLRLLLPCIVVLTASTAQAAESFVRLGAAVKAPRPLAANTTKVLSDALAASTFTDTVSPEIYAREAARMRVRRPMLPTSVHKVGQHLHVTHVLTVSIVGKNKGMSRQLFADALVYDVINDRLLFKQRYFLPEHKLTSSIATFILMRVETILTGRAAKTEETEPPTAEAPQMHGHEIDTQHLTQKPEGAEEGLSADAEPSDEEENASVFAGHSHFSAGFDAGLRKAILSSGGNVLPLCYCNNGTFGAPMPGVHAAFSMFFDPNVTNFGFDLDGYVELAGTNVPGDAGNVITLHTPFWRVQAAPAYRINLPADVELFVLAGFNYERYPLSMGAFPGLTYSAPLAELRAAIPLGTDAVVLSAAGTYLPYVIAGLEANLLGQPAAGMGIRAEAALRVSVWVLEFTAMAQWEQVTMSFSGPTALYAATKFANVALNDQHLDLSISLGSHF